MVNVDRDELLKFLAEAGKNTYAAPKEIRSKHRCETPILPGHKDYHYKKGDWSYHDSYAGSLQAPGREVVFFQKIPVWSMSYQGQSDANFPEEFFQGEVFPFLKKALLAAPEEMPFRGPVSFKEGDFEYSFDMVGNWRYFTGVERIFHQKKLEDNSYISRVKGLFLESPSRQVFTQDVMGGLII